jgi:secreted trypsin-like serine protease
VAGQSASRITVILNEQDFSSNSDGAKPVSIRVEHIKMHENYNSQNIDNDIAVWNFI